NAVNKARQEPKLYLATLLHLLNSAVQYMGHPQVIALYLDQFDEAPPPLSVSVAKSFEITETARSAFIGLFCAVEHDTHQSLGIYSIQRDDGGMLHVSILVVLDYLLRKPSSVAIIAVTKGALAMTTEMYLDLGKRPPDNEGDVISRIKCACWSLVALLQSPLPDFGEFIQTVGWKTQKAARKLFRPLQLCTLGGSQWMNLVPCIINVHLQLMAHQPEYYRSLPPSMVMFDMCILMTSCHDHVAPPTPRGLPFPKHDYILLPLKALTIYALSIPRDHAWMVYALCKGMLPLLLKSAPYSKADPGITKHIRTIMDRVQAYSIFRPVLRLLLADPAVVERRFSTNDQGRDFIESPYNIAFFQFLIEREMIDIREDLEKQRDQWLGDSSKPPPYLFLVNYAEDVPPSVAVELISPTADIQEIGLNRLPVYLPFVTDDCLGGLTKWAFEEGTNWFCNRAG
ncbi:hypothetical protein DXG01_005765, partial [Tephrocybe rancida]